MSLKLKLVGIVVLVAVATWLGLQLMRPEAKVVVAKRDRGGPESVRSLLPRFLGCAIGVTNLAKTGAKRGWVELVEGEDDKDCDTLR